MIPWLGKVVFWHWWVLGVVLLVLEMMAPGAFFLWMAVAAGVVGFVILFAPNLAWEYQILVFAVLSVVSIVAWRIYLQKNPTQTDEPLLNRRGAQYVGRIFILDADMPVGRGKIQVDDTTWRVVCDDGQDLSSGSRVKVVDVDGTTLKIEPA
jgi:membrane protein implicated in regulation of membrane protease activity